MSQPDNQESAHSSSSSFPLSIPVAPSQGASLSATSSSSSTPFLSSGDEPWTLIDSKSASFPARYFLSVLENLIKNPNITSSCVFRADIYYDSDTHAPAFSSKHEDHLTPNDDAFIQQLQAEYRPLDFHGLADDRTGDGYELRRTVVRKLIPRNPKLDRALVQTCHFFAKRRRNEGNGYHHSSISTSELATRNESKFATEEDVEDEDCILVMLPHAKDATSIPFYHPKVRGLALRYNFTNQFSSTLRQEFTPSSSELFIYFSMFPDTPMDNRLSRTALNLLATIHKHATGQAAGYKKRVHHDQIVPQARVQDTYTRLKLKYAKTFSEGWAEQTDPTKHVFEDLGIAAFLIELWRDMYPSDDSFPGYVDIGCGNGLLVNILIQEGYSGLGFDARARKSWTTFPANVQKHLSAKILVPSILNQWPSSGYSNDDQILHDGIFTPGVFIISNHADELTPWTPLLAFLNQSPFIAIPCCSHNLAGARCRFHVRDAQSKHSDGVDMAKPTMVARVSAQEGPGPAQGSLSRPKSASKPPSAYQSLTSYVSSLAVELGFVVRKEMLRIPSTRNAAVVGTVPMAENAEMSRNSSADASRTALVTDLVRREVGDLDLVSKDWMQRAEHIARSTKSGH